MNNPSLDACFNLALFFELSADFLCIAGYDGYYKKINPTVSRLLGYSEAELLARPINGFVYPEDREITSKYRKNLTQGIPLLNFENRYLTKTGEIVWLSWTSMPVEREQLVYAIAKNVTHHKKIEADRNVLLASLTKINAELKQLTYTASHDMRAPVNNLLAVFSLLDITTIDDPDTRKFINLLKDATDVLKGNLNKHVDLLGHKHTSSAVLEELSLNQILTHVLSSLGSLLQHARATLNIDFSGLDSLSFNRSYLESIFLNLITNAIKYARPDFAPIISISSRRKNGVPQLIFSDNGRGFDMTQAKDKVFGFHQTFHHHADSKGIGLYLVHNHITSLGGHISLESNVNEGATFTLSFPV